MAGWRLLFDLDSCDERLTKGLADLGWNCAAGNALGLEEWDDPDILARAAAEERAVYTCNRVDFARLHEAWMQEGRSHAGIVVRFPQKASSERQLAALLRIHQVYGDNISNQLVWANADILNGA